MGFVHPDYCGQFDGVWAIDNDSSAIESYNTNLGAHGVCGNIEDWVAKYKISSIPQADVVIGGPPCQGFSLLNKQRKGDVRRGLWEPFMDVVAVANAQVFVIENVQGLLRTDECSAILARADQLGYKTVSAILNSADYGTPQIRKRAFIIGSKVGAVQFPPSPTHSSPSCDLLPDWNTVHDAIGDLPDPEGVEIRYIQPPLDIHFGRRPTEVSKMRYRAVPPGGNRFDLQKNAPEITPACWIKKKSGGTDLFGRLWWDRPSVTIRTEFFKPEKGRYLHPEKHRPITHREAARLMGFPDWFVFKGTKIEIARQIGNAVPPDMGAAVANVVASILSAAKIEAA